MSAPELTRLQRVTYRVWLAVGLLVLGAVAFYVLARPFAVLVPPLLVALLLVYLLNPVVSGFRRLGIPRLLGTLISFALFFGSIVGIGALLGPPLAEQVASFAEIAPELWTQTVDQVNAWSTRLGVDLEIGGRLDAVMLAEQVQDFLADAEARGAVLSVLGGLSGVASGLFTVGLAFVAGPFIAAYLLWDLPRVEAWIYRAIPPGHREEVLSVGRRLSAVVGGFIRGQLIVATYVGVATSIGLAIIGLPFWLVLGVAAGVSNLVPFIGPFIAGVLGVLVALFTDGVGLAILVVVVMVVVQQGDSQLVSPLVMGKTVRLHPLVVLLALLVAGTLYGIFGLLVAVPLVAGANVLLSHLWRTRVPWAGEDEPAPPRRPRGRRARRRAAADARAAPAPSPPSEETGATDGPPPTAAEPPRSAPRARR